MAIEAHHLNSFHPQLIGNRRIISSIEGNFTNMYNTPIGYSLHPLSETTTTTETNLLPMYNSSVITDSIPSNTTMKSHRGLTYNVPISRKRSRDSTFAFLGDDVSVQIQQQQLEIDSFIAQHTKKVRFEIEERRKSYSRRIISALEEGITRKLREREEIAEKIAKLNFALEERVKSLCYENQIWRDFAQTSEAKANSLRSNLEQVLLAAQVSNHRRGACLEDAVDLTYDDAQSCCGSNYCGGGDEVVEEDQCTLAGEGGGRKVVKDKSTGDDYDCTSGDHGTRNWCRNCGKEESCVLLLPCRHLCLCTVCGCTVHTCPICKSNKNASVHVNMSS